MLRSLGPIRGLSPSPVVVRRLLVTNVVVQVAIVVTGGVVRLTGSGLGCTTAPECTPGRVTPFADQHISIHRAIEFGNRMLTTVVGLVALLAVVAVWRWGRRSLRGWAVGPLVLTLVQAVLGAITVRTGLNPATVMAHFLVSMVLVTVSTVLLVRFGEGDGAPRPVVRNEPRAARSGLRHGARRRPGGRHAGHRDRAARG